MCPRRKDKKTVARDRINTIFRVPEIESKCPRLSAENERKRYELLRDLKIYICGFDDGAAMLLSGPDGDTQLHRFVSYVIDDQNTRRGDSWWDRSTRSIINVVLARYCHELNLVAYGKKQL